MATNTLKVSANDMSGSVPVKTQRSRAGSMPKNMQSLKVDERNLVIGSNAAMDCSPVKDKLGDTTNLSRFPGTPEADIDINKRG